MTHTGASLPRSVLYSGDPNGVSHNRPGHLKRMDKRRADMLAVLDLGTAPYMPVHDLQARLRAGVANGDLPGVVLLLEHEPVITLGSRGARSDLRAPALLRSRGVEVAKSERGGQATLHAPGQMVVYPIIPIPRQDLRSYVHDLEEVLMRLLNSLRVAGERRDKRPGVYVNGEKIASVGLRCSRWVSSHGTSLNVNVDLTLFELIVSCGEPDLRQTSLQAVTGCVYDMEEVKGLYLRAAQQVFGWDLSPTLRVAYDRVEETLGRASS
jgi:lipoyl(octanoyl) transferase